MLEPRFAIRNMRPYSPPTSGRAAFERLDFNENTVGCSPAVLAALQGLSAADLAVYPDYEEVLGRLSGFFGVDGSQLVLTNGTDEAIQLVVNTYVEPGDEVIVLTPTYAMYRFYAEVAGARVVEVPLVDTGREFVVDLEAVLATVSDRTKAVFLPNPNNPTGNVIPQDVALEIVRACPEAAVLVDEAYFEFYGETVLGRVSEFGNLFVSRTFSKAYGLAGLRFGCLISSAGNAANLSKGHSPYSVNAVGCRAVLAAIEDQDWLAGYVKEALAARAVIEGGLDSLGVKRWFSDANFVLFDGGGRSSDILAACRKDGILIRDRDHDVAGTLRVTAGTVEQATRFLAVLAR